MLKVIEEFPNYKIDEYGNVFNRDGKRLKPQINKDGYRILILSKNGKGYCRRCGRLVGLTFLKDTYRKGLVINHKDFDRTNDHISNLEWVTTLENNLHSIEGNPSAHLSGSEYDEEFMRKVCELIQDNVRNSEIIKITGITKDALHKVRSGTSWTWVSKDYKMTPSRRGVSEKTVIWVCHQLNDGKTYDEILRESTCKSLTRDILKKIKNKKSWVRVTKDILK